MFFVSSDKYFLKSAALTAEYGPALLSAALFILLAILSVQAFAAEIDGEASPSVSESLTDAAAQEDASSMVIFQGNSFFSDKQLREAAKAELIDFGRLGGRKAEADDAAYEMEQFYKRAGFAFAVVLYRLEDGETKQVTFTIEEGPQVMLKEVFFSGNEFFTTTVLQEIFKAEQDSTSSMDQPVYVEAIVKSALNNIRDLYYNEGFLDAEIRDSKLEFTADRNMVILTVEITEGLRYTMQNVVFNGDLVPQAQDDLNMTAAELTGKPYFRRRKLLIKSRVLEIYGNLGYPDVAVSIAEERNRETGAVILTVTINAGPKVTIAGVDITGNKKTKQKFIKSRLQFDTGTPYSLSGRRESFHALYRTGLFSQVTMHLEETEEPEKRILVVEVNEAPSRELFMEAGWGSYELLRLGFGIRDKNFRGAGRTVRTEARFSLKGESAEIGITDPWFLGTDIVADLPVYYSRREEPSFSRQDTGASLLLSKRLTASLTATLGYSLRWTETKDIDIVTPVSTAEADDVYNMASIKAQATWDTRNDILFPSTGYRNFLAAEVADRLIGSEINLVRFSAGSRHFRQLTKTLIFGIRYSTGLVLPVRNQVTIPLPERFFNGGENTVRSFDESMLGPLDLAGNPVGGMAFNVINIELRHRITSKIILSLFTDLGNVSPNRSQAEKGEPPYTDRSQLIETTFKEYFRDFRTAVGIGIQYLLPVGPVRLDFGVNPDPRQERYEERYNFHFSVGMAF